MYYTLRAVALIGVVAILSGRAGAQGVGMQRTISLNMAKTIAEATLTECKSKGYNTAVAVVDRAGQVLVVMRDENVSAQQVVMALSKAYNARMLRTSTLE